MLSKMKKAHGAFVEDYGREPTEIELATHTDIPMRQLRQLLAHWHSVSSLDAPLSRGPTSAAFGGAPTTLLEDSNARPFTAEQTLEEQLEQRLVCEQLSERLDQCLPPFEARVLRLRYGLGDSDSLSWAQIAAECDASVTGAQLARNRALRKLRKREDMKQLMELCGEHPQL